MKDHYPNLQRRAERLTYLAEHGAGGLSGEIARRTIRLAFGLEHGLEGFTVGEELSSDAVPVEYVNRGDTYDETLVRTGDLWQVSCWGDALEQAEQSFSEATGLNRCQHCGEWSEYIDPDDYRGTCCGAVDPDALDADEILEGAARALFVSAYADAAERAEEDGEEFDGDTPGPGEDWLDYAPDTPAEAAAQAGKLLATVANLNLAHGEADPVSNLTSEDSILRGLCADWIQAGGTGDRFGSPEFIFGFYLAMEALGHGVGLSDNLPTDSKYKSPRTPMVDGIFDGGEYCSG
jgi:hypothetical protein